MRRSSGASVAFGTRRRGLSRKAHAPSEANRAADLEPRAAAGKLIHVGPIEHDGLRADGDVADRAAENPHRTAERKLRAKAAASEESRCDVLPCDRCIARRAQPPERRERTPR